MLISRLTLSGLTLITAFVMTACTQPTPSSSEAEPSTTQVESAEPASTIPDETAENADTTPPEPESAVTTVARTGTFASAEHETTGRAELVSTNGQQTLKFDGAFATSDGPDLVVVLHRSANVIGESTPPAYPLNEADYVVIAPLMAISGAQEYVVPAEIDLTEFESVAVWCQAFNATFGAATLQ